MEARRLGNVRNAPPAVYYAVRVLPRSDGRAQPGSEEAGKGAKGRWRPIDLGTLREREGGPLPAILSTRRWLGELVPAERVASELLERAPDAEALRVVIETRRIDPDTGMVVAERVRAQASRR